MKTYNDRQVIGVPEPVALAMLGLPQSESSGEICGLCIFDGKKECTLQIGEAWYCGTSRSTESVTWMYVDDFVAMRLKGVPNE